MLYYRLLYYIFDFKSPSKFVAFHYLKMVLSIKKIEKLILGLGIIMLELITSITSIFLKRKSTSILELSTSLLLLFAGPDFKIRSRFDYSIHKRY